MHLIGDLPFLVPLQLLPCKLTRGDLFAIRAQKKVGDQEDYSHDANPCVDER